MFQFLPILASCNVSVAIQLFALKKINKAISNLEIKLKKVGHSFCKMHILQ